MLLDQPLPGPAELQTRAVHQQMNGLRIAARPRPRHLQGLRPAAQGGMVGNREIETQQANDRADQAFGLAQSQTEHGLERQGRRDRQIRVVRLTARRGARLGVPGRDRLLREPDRQAPALAQGGIILGPVRDPAPLLRDTMPAISIGLERHRGIQGHRRGRPPTPAIPRCQPPDPCNKLKRIGPRSTGLGLSRSTVRETRSGYRAKIEIDGRADVLPARVYPPQVCATYRFGS